MSIASEGTATAASGSASIGLRRLFTSPGVHPYDEVVWDRRDARISNWQTGAVAFEQLDVEFPTSWSQNATNIVAQKYFRGSPGTTSAGVVAATGRRPHRRHDHTVGRRGRLLRRPGRSRRVHRRTEVHPHHPAGGVQQPGVVQHRCRRRASTGLGVLHPVGRRRDELDPQLVPGGGDHLQGRLRRGGQPVADPFVEGADDRRWHRFRTRELHARCRRIGRNDQVGWEDPPRRQDGHPRCRPPGHRGVHLVQGDRGAQGPGVARRRLRHGPRRCRLVLRAVPERQQLGPGDRRVHAGRRRRRRVAPHRRHHRRGARDRAGPRTVAPDGRGSLGMRRPRPPVRHHDQQLAHRPGTRPNHRQ